MAGNATWKTGEFRRRPEEVWATYLLLKIKLEVEV